MPLVGFTGDAIKAEGRVTLPLTLGEFPRQRTLLTDFSVVHAPSPYNAILDRPILNYFRAVTSIYHLMVKFPTTQRVGVVRADQ